MFILTLISFKDIFGTSNWMLINLWDKKTKFNTCPAFFLPNHFRGANAFYPGVSEETVKTKIPKEKKKACFLDPFLLLHLNIFFNI